MNIVPFVTKLADLLDQDTENGCALTGAVHVSGQIHAVKTREKGTKGAWELTLSICLGPSIRTSCDGP